MYDNFLEMAIDLARQTGKIHLSYFRGNNLSITTKSNVSDVVTKADKESEDFIASKILGQFPDHKILGEEGGYRGQATSDYLWVVDPLDGTTNFSQGLPIFCVSIGLQYKNETIVGVVYAPYLDELYYATKQGGAYLICRGQSPQKLWVSTKKSLDCSVIATGFPYDKGTNLDNNSANVTRIVPLVRDLRRLGSAAYDLCAVASSTLDGYWEMSLNLWDVCAGNLIVEEAGGTIFPFRNDRNVSIIAGNPTITQLIHQHIK